MSYYRYCPKCGRVETYDLENCLRCKTELIETDIKIDYSYYCAHKEEITQQIYDQYKVTENPLYDLKAVERRIEKDKEIEAIGHRPPVQLKAKCPTCGSTSVRHITTVDRAVSIGFLGLFSGDIGKNYECLTGKAKW